MAEPFTIPSLYSYLQTRARLHPHEPAVLVEGATITFREFCVQIDGVSRSLQALGLPAGARVMVMLRRGYMSRLVYLALNRLGMVPVVSHLHGVVQPAAVIADEAGVSGEFREILVQQSWLRGVADGLPAVADVPRAPSDDCTIVLSSGTTGTPKMAVFTREQLNTRLRAIIADYAFTRATRVSSSMGMSTMGGLLWPIAAWAAGGSVVLASAGDIKPDHYARHGITDTFLSPAQFDELLRRLPPDRIPANPPSFYVAGSTLTRQLNANARLRLGSKLFNVYGSTEAGTIAIAPFAHMDANSALTGYLIPPVQVEIAGPDGRAVPPGTVGEVRVRNLGMVERYADDPEATANIFKDGWFHPGDLGYLGPRGELCLTGRVAELMNFGGGKFTPTVMEERLGEVPHASELAIFALPADAGDRPCIAVVAKSEKFSTDDLIARFKAAFPHVPAPTVFRMESLPRNEMGKVLRGQLVQQATAIEATASGNLH